MQEAIIRFTKKDAATITGGLSQTTKMPCPSYSLPTLACQTGFKMAQIAGSICSECYANAGNYVKYAASIEPAQHARLDSLNDPLWTEGMIRLITGHDYFRWHDSGDLQSLEHLEKIVAVCNGTPETFHWLPTREYGIVKQYIAKYGRDSVPRNLMIRLSAMYIDKPVIVPKSLQGIRGISASNVHSDPAKPLGSRCTAPDREGKCGPCRDCWHSPQPVSYEQH